eukprot:420350-Alexandrium_andersonii.AAC.1
MGGDLILERLGALVGQPSAPAQSAGSGQNAVGQQMQAINVTLQNVQQLVETMQGQNARGGGSLGSFHTLPRAG